MSKHEPLTDGVGSAIALTDSNGVIQTEYTYAPFGQTTTSGTASNNSAQYSGRENDGTGLYFYRARYYSPPLHRFISEDPLGLGAGPNLYAYVGNNPINLTDPFGLSPDSDPTAPLREGIVAALLAVMLMLELMAILAMTSGPGGMGAGIRRAPVAGVTPRAALGDLTAAEIAQIQGVVNRAGRPLEVVGSAARGARTAASDIDYLIPHSSREYFKGLEGQLPGVDPGTGFSEGLRIPFWGLRSGLNRVFLRPLFLGNSEGHGRFN